MEASEEARGEETSESTLWLRQLYAGLIAYAGVALAIFVYTAATWTQAPNRAWLALLSAVAFGHVPIVWLYRWLVIGSRHRLAFFVAWNMASYLAIMLGCIADGGISSPIALLWFLPTIYLSLGYPRNAILLCAPFGVALYVVAAALTPQPFPYDWFALELVLLCESLLMVLLGADARDRREKGMRLLRERLAVLASTDDLTGCLNQRAFMHAMKSEVERAARYGHGISLLALDVDQFKRINDTYGHMVGDQVLRKIGAVLRDTVRQTDIAGRLGGDELAVLCPETDTDAATLLAERLRAAVAAVSTEITVTLSIGICEMHSDAAHVDVLRHRADRALYEAKQNGRDGYAVFRAAAG